MVTCSHLRVNLVEEERQTVVEEVHLADPLPEHALHEGLEVRQDELLDRLVLRLAAVVGVLVAGERLAEEDDNAGDGGVRRRRRDLSVLA